MLTVTTGSNVRTAVVRKAERIEFNSPLMFRTEKPNDKIIIIFLCRSFSPFYLIDQTARTKWGSPGSSTS